MCSLRCFGIDLGSQHAWRIQCLSLMHQLCLHSLYRLNNHSLLMAENLWQKGLLLEKNATRYSKIGKNDSIRWTLCYDRMTVLSYIRNSDFEYKRNWNASSLVLVKKRISNGQWSLSLSLNEVQNTWIAFQPSQSRHPRCIVSRELVRDWVDFLFEL